MRLRLLFILLPTWMTRQTVEINVLSEGRNANVHIEAEAVVHTVAYRLI